MDINYQTDISGLETKLGMEIIEENNNSIHNIFLKVSIFYFFSLSFLYHCFTFKIFLAYVNSAE